MSSFLDEVASDLSEAETDLGGEMMTWNAQRYPVAASLVRRGAVLVVGGKEIEIKLTLRVAYEGRTTAGRDWEFSTLPKHGERVTFNDINYRIAQVNNAHSAFLEIDLMDANR